MKQDKKAFLLPLAGALLPMFGGMGAASLGSRFLAPGIRRFAAGQLAKRQAARAAAVGAADLNNPGVAVAMNAAGKAPTRMGRAYDRSLNWMKKRRNADNISTNLGFTLGGIGTGVLTAPLMGMEDMSQQQMAKYSHAVFTGFMKAAEDSGLSNNTISTLFKKAFSNESLTPDDVAKIRLALREQGTADAYGDPAGQLNANYNQSLLRARDASLEEVPELAAGATAARRGLAGASVGGIGGYALGSILNNPGMLGDKIPYGFKSRLPIGLGTSGAVIGALINALPAYKQKVDQVKGLQKLHSPENMQRLLSNMQMDKAILNS